MNNKIDLVESVLAHKAYISRTWKTKSEREDNMSPIAYRKVNMEGETRYYIQNLRETRPRGLVIVRNDVIFCFALPANGDPIIEVEGQGNPEEENLDIYIEEADENAVGRTAGICAIDYTGASQIRDLNPDDFEPPEYPSHCCHWWSCEQCPDPCNEIIF